jgi:hypothetical protein
MLTKFFRQALRWMPVFVAALFIAPGIIGTGATAAYAADRQVPFAGSYTGIAGFGSNGAPVFSGTGTATQLGHSASAGYVVFTTAPAACAGGVPNDNYEILTAANGDSFTIVSHDVACPIGPYEYHGSGNWEVVPGSGMGRFTGVTGQGTFDGQSDFGQGTFAMQLTGTISEP